jgi:hypothetical protein
MTLRARLRALSMTQTELSTLTGITLSTIERYAAGPSRADRLDAPLVLIRLMDAWERCPDALAAARAEVTLDKSAG